MISIDLKFYNDCYNVFIESDVAPGKGRLIAIADRNGGEFRLRHHEHPELDLYSFGFMAHYKSDRPTHGGEWSSREGVVNPIFGKTLTHVAVNNTCYAMEVKDLESILPDGYEIVPVTKLDNERYYEVQKS